MKISLQKIGTGIVILIFLIGIPGFVIYDIVKGIFKDAAKIDKSEMLIVEDDKPQTKKPKQDDSAAEKIMDSLETAAVERDSNVIFNGFTDSSMTIAPKKRTPEEIAADKRKDSIMERKLDSIYNYNQQFSNRLKGNKLSVLITGIDSRLGSNLKHADANHLVNIFFDTGFIEIISMPRGTLADAGFDDSTENYLANVRSNRGHRIYMEEIKRISGVNKIDYFVEFGFSEAIGLMELLGFKGKSVQMLRMLRHRKSYAAGDHQRSYNQGQFIRQMILNLFPKLEGAAGELILRGGLYLVRTDLNMDIVNNIIDKLKASGFPKTRSDVIVRMKPRYSLKYRYNFLDETSRDSLYQRIADYSGRVGLKSEINNSTRISDKVYETLYNLIVNVELDTLDRPKRVIKILNKPYNQKAWLQISDSTKRSEMRERICTLLIASYNKTNKQAKAEKIQKRLEVERKVLK